MFTTTYTEVTKVQERMNSLLYVSIEYLILELIELFYYEEKFKQRWKFYEHEYENVQNRKESK